MNRPFLNRIDELHDFLIGRGFERTTARIPGYGDHIDYCKWQADLGEKEYARVRLYNLSYFEVEWGHQHQNEDLFWSWVDVRSNLTLKENINRGDVAMDSNSNCSDALRSILWTKAEKLKREILEHLGL